MGMLDGIVPIPCIFCDQAKSEFEFWDRRLLANRCKECDQKAKRHSLVTRLWCGAKQRSFDKRLPFDIEESDIVIPETCPVLGIKLNPGKHSRFADDIPSLDKLIPKLGYVKGNISVISWRANRIKNDGTIDEHQKIIDWMRAQGAETSDEPKD